MTCLGDIKISRSGGQIIFYHRLGLDWNRHGHNELDNNFVSCPQETLNPPLHGLFFSDTYHLIRITICREIANTV